MFKKEFLFRLQVFILAFAIHLSACLGLNVSANGDDSVPVLAAQDEIWSQTYQILDVRLREHLGKKQSSAAIQRLARRFNLSEREAGAFINYASNYTIHSMNVEKALIRYPHYNAEALAQDFAALVSAKLIASNDGTGRYSATDLGRRLVDAYWLLKIEEAAGFSLEFSDAIETLYRSLEKVASRAAEMEDGGINESIKWRRMNRSSVLDRAPHLVKVYEAYGDFVAYINDNAHYRFDRLAAKTNEERWRKMALTPLAKELLASMRNGRLYRLNQCVDQRNWRQPRSECERAFAELETAGLIEGEADEYKQTSSGSSYFRAAEELTDERLYRPWSALSRAEYVAYKEALARVGKILGEEKK